MSLKNDLCEKFSQSRFREVHFELVYALITVKVSGIFISNFWKKKAEIYSLKMLETTQTQGSSRTKANMGDKAHKF